MLEVCFTARDPAVAAEGANLAMQLYIADQLDQKVAAVRRASAWLDDRVNELRGAVARPRIGLPPIGPRTAWRRASMPGSMPSASAG